MKLVINGSVGFPRQIVMANTSFKDDSYKYSWNQRQAKSNEFILNEQKITANEKSHKSMFVGFLFY